MQEINQLLLNVAYTLHNSSDFLMKKWLFKYKDMNTEWQKFRIPSDFKTCYFGLISEVQCWRVYFFSGRKSHAVINWYQLYKPETCKVKTHHKGQQEYPLFWRPGEVSAVPKITQLETGNHISWQFNSEPFQAPALSAVSSWYFLCEMQKRERRV